MKSRVDFSLSQHTNGSQPGDIDILCGKGRGSYEHVGNQNYRDELLKNLDLYENARTKPDKTQVVESILFTLRENGTYFVEKEENDWYDIGNVKAKRKTSRHAIRDHLTRSKKKQSENSISRNTNNNTMINSAQRNVYVGPAPLERQTSDVSDISDWSQFASSHIEWF